MPEERFLNEFRAIHPRIRRRFPQLNKDIHGNRRIHLNCGAGTLMVDTAARALAQAGSWLNSLPGEIYPAEITTGEFHWSIRQIVADFLNAASPDEISFHFSASQALFNLAYSTHGLIRARNNLIVTDLDHMANISPWESLGGKWWGGEVRRARITEDGRLDPDHLLSLVDENTVVVAVTLASNGIGTIVPLKELIAEIRAKSPACLVCVDAVHHALHGPIDVRRMDCDFLVFSGYKVFGPMLGVLWGKKPLLAKLKPYRVETNKNELPFRFEQGTLPNASLGSLGAALQYFLWLADELRRGEENEERDRKAGFKTAMTAISAFEREITRIVLRGFERFDKNKFIVYGLTDPAHCDQRHPTFAFEIPGLSAREVKKCLWERRGIQIADGNHYSAVFYRHLRKGSVCRASFAHYNSFEDAKKFLEAVEELQKATEP